ncbi:hypothetical protein M426DRAFT_319168 [Hypoxylon sp. CI-4A]|nr:hypothetical protein M426DRAFT_319168 [Hypoxylon sp. CI-4A]
MPRLPPSLLRRARSISTHLATLLPVCRDLNAAQNELRWIREHVSNLRSSAPSRSTRASAIDEQLLLKRLCQKRGKGAPLQYVLGTQPFGDLEIKCRPGVLIPRPETEAWVARLADVVRRDGIADGVHHGGEMSGLRIWDLCTGTGCIALLLSSLLRRRFPGLDVRGFDVEPRAVALARENLRFNAQQGVLSAVGQNVEFEEVDIFSEGFLSSFLTSVEAQDVSKSRVDVLVSNPPYISARGFNRDTERSVRNYEPKLALVPQQDASLSSFPDARPEDVFYARLLEIAKVLQPRFMVFEVGDLKQGLRVVQLARSRFNDLTIEIWRDWPDMTPAEDEPESIQVNDIIVPIRGSGNGRAVFIRQTI